MISLDDVIPASLDFVVLGLGSLKDCWEERLRKLCDLFCVELVVKA